MKLLSVFISSLILLVACASPRSFDMGLVQNEAIRVSNDKDMYFMNIPSRGAIADAALIAADGGGIAKQLSAGLASINAKGGGSITVTSANPELPKSVIEGALKLLDSRVDNFLLVYAGDSQYSDSVQAAVEGKGFTYTFIDISTLD